jgi:hypothetical protein
MTELATRPLEAFGHEPSAMVAQLPAGEGIEFVGSASLDVRHGYVIAGERRIDVDRTIALPVLSVRRSTACPRMQAIALSCALWWPPTKIATRYLAPICCVARRPRC